MHIKHITVKNFRCFEHLEFDLNPDVNIFVGNNGSGKSAVLDAIAAAMYRYIFAVHAKVGNPMEDIPLYNRDFFTRKKNEIQETQMKFDVVVTTLPSWDISYQKSLTDNGNKKLEYTNSSLASNSLDEIIKYSDLLSEIDKIFNSSTNDSSINLSVIAYYTSERNLTNTNYFKTEDNEAFNRINSLTKTLNATADFSSVLNWLFVREFQEFRECKIRGDINYELPDLKQIRKAITTIIAPDARVYCSLTSPVQLMVEWTMETGEKRELTLNQLSAGYRNMLALVMDFARRLAQANPHLENPLEAEAILMIDELDLHLHPTWQQKIIPDLRKVFPNTQIIATTHSPEIVTTVEYNEVWILEDYQIKACPYPTKGMKSSDMVRYVLGLENLRPDTEESRKLTALFNAIDNGNIEEAKRLQKELESWESFDADMTRADMQIRRLERRMSV
jgi:predicted ATP-binding protein involved in virulence